MWVWLEARTDLLESSRRVLHVAPEPSVSARLRECPDLAYVTGNRELSASDVVLDVCDLPWADSSFDVVFCNHVLEHVRDDRRAMREIARVIAPGGWAVLLVPHEPDAGTDEDPDASPAERVRRFRQEDHVRLYGRDYVDRLTDAGFDVDASQFGETLPPEDFHRYGLQPGETLFVGRVAQGTLAPEAARIDAPQSS